MKYEHAAARVGIITAVMVFLVTAMTTVSAEAKQFNLRNQLQKNNISLKIVRLDRTDGFKFGLAITGHNKTVILAPGFNRMWLARVGDNEVILQPDASGNMQIIQADTGDIQYVVCVLSAVLTFISDLTMCEQDPACLLTSIIELVTDIVTCDQVTSDPGY